MGIFSIFNNRRKIESAETINLTESDIGKVFIIENRKSEQNFGQYLILLSTNSDLYSFETFDINNNIPVGKLIVSFPKKLKYKEVKIDNDLLKKAKLACEIRMSDEKNKLQEQIKLRSENSMRLKEWYNIDNTLSFNQFGDIQDSNLKFGIWIDGSKKQFVLQIYSEKEILGTKNINWTNDPLWGISSIDEKIIFDNLNKLLTEIENR